MVAQARGPNDAKRRLRTSRRSSRRTAPMITITTPATSDGRSGRCLATRAPDAGRVARLAVDVEAPMAEAVRRRIDVADVEDADADVAVDHEPRRPRGGLAVVAPVDVEAAGAVVEDVDLTGADVRRARDADVARYDDRRGSRADLDAHAVVARGQVRVAQVDDHLADAEAVAVADLARRDRPVRAVA